MEQTSSRHTYIRTYTTIQQIQLEFCIIMTAHEGSGMIVRSSFALCCRKTKTKYMDWCAKWCNCVGQSQKRKEEA